MLTVLRHPTDLGFTSACRVATGRSAILHMARRWNPDIVFMPCYVPEGVINPFIESGARIVFYGLNQNLTPRIADLASLIKANPSERGILVLIEYFGFPAWYGSMRAELPGFDGLIFLDCAHSAKSQVYTDAVLCVFNKLLPVTDGAVIYSRLPELDLTLDDSALPPMPAMAIEAYERHLGANMLLASTNDAKHAEIALAQSEIAYETYYQIISNNMEPWAQSAASRIIEGVIDWHTFAEHRTHKSNILRRNLPRRLAVRDDASAQFAYPIRCYGQREDMVAALSRIGVIAGACNDRWDHIPDKGFDFETEFIDDHLLLPISEEVDDVKMLAIANALKKFK